MALQEKVFDLPPCARAEDMVYYVSISVLGW